MSSSPIAARVAPDFETIRVRISSQDRRGEVRIAGTALGVQEFRLEGGQVVSSAGGRGPAISVAPRPDGLGLELAGRIYRGELLVEPHGARGLRVTNLVPLEDYVAGVVPAELVLWSAEPAEIQAQAIAARTYALRSLVDRSRTSRDVFLWDDTRDQVYQGRFSAGSSDAARRVDVKLEKALRASRGQVLVDASGGLFDVRFHASCGGHTTTPARAFPLESEVTTGAVACRPCEELGALERSLSPDDSRRRSVHWTWTASRADLDGLARSLDVGAHVQRLRPVSRDDYGRWLTVEVEGDRGRRTLDVTRLRAELDPARLKSGLMLRTWPPPGELIRAGLLFEGLGRGHGAGLCQVGSHQLAAGGWSARRILAYYLSGSTLSDVRSALAAPKP